MSKIRVLNVVVMLFWVMCSVNAHAATIMYTDRSLWQSAVLASGGSLTNIDFENATVSRSETATVVRAGDVSFTDCMARMLLIANSPAVYASGKMLDFSFNQPVDISLPSGVYAFGFDLAELVPLGNPLVPATLEEMRLSTGETFIGPYTGNPYPTFAFFGFVSDIPITDAWMHPHALVEPFLDNFTFGQIAQPVPEPLSMLLMSSGIFGLMLRSWLKRRHSRE